MSVDEWDEFNKTKKNAPEQLPVEHQEEEDDDDDVDDHNYQEINISSPPLSPPIESVNVRNSSPSSPTTRTAHNGVLQQGNDNNTNSEEENLINGSDTSSETGNRHWTPTSTGHE